MTAPRKCPNCRRRVTGHPNKRFCGSKCKDKYHNRTNPRGYFAHSGSIYLNALDDPRNEEELSWDGHKS